MLWYALAVQIGDKILVVIKGPHGCGLVEAVVESIYSTSSHFVASVRSPNSVFATQDEGLTWTRGHDRSSPAAEALLVAAVL